MRLVPISDRCGNVCYVNPGLVRKVHLAQGPCPFTCIVLVGEESPLETLTPIEEVAEKFLGTPNERYVDEDPSAGDPAPSSPGQA